MTRAYAPRYTSLGSLNYGADMVVNGAFAADTNWTKGTGWSIAAGVASKAAGAATVLEPSAALTIVAGLTYEVTYTMSGFSAGTCTVSIGGTAGTPRGSDATFTEQLVAANTTNLKFTANAAGAYNIDDVSVKLVNNSLGPFQARDLMATDSGVLTIVGDVQASGGGTVAVEYYVDEAGLLGGAGAEEMNTASGYVLHLAVSPDVWIKLTMSGITTDDIDFYAC